MVAVETNAAAWFGKSPVCRATVPCLLNVERPSIPSGVAVATPQIHLASASPRRSDILSSLGIAHSFAGVDIDEKAAKNEIASDLVLRLAREKALAAERTDYADLPVLA
ncbi:MAG: hypothetical protein HOI35_17420, partial [Woeseia sp.]|nr:hypothetical protein [Woeseia sp.]